MGDDDFIKKESIRRSFRRDEYQEKQRDQQYQNQKRADEQRRFTNEQREYRESHQAKRDIEAREERESRDIARTENQWHLLETKRQQAIEDANHKVVATLEAEQEKTKRETSLFEMEVERDARMLKAEQDFDPVRRARDLQDYRTRSLIDAQEYASRSMTNLKEQRQLHRNRMSEIKLELHGRLVESALSHKQTKDLSAQEHQQKKDFERCQTDEKIYLFKECAKIKRQEQELTNQDILNAVSDIQGFEHESSIKDFDPDSIYVDSQGQAFKSGQLEKEYESFYVNTDNAEGKID